MQTRHVDSGQMKKCLDFAKNAQPQPHEWNDPETGVRTKGEYRRNIFVGLVAECAVCDLLREHGVDIPDVNFDIYAPGSSDTSDFEVGSKTVGVKSTARGQWLMVHDGNLRKGVFDYYVLCRSVVDGKELPTGEVKILGWCKKDELVNEARLNELKSKGHKSFDSSVVGSKSERREKGSVAPWGTQNLQSSNLCIQGSAMNQDFGELAASLRKSGSSEPTEGLDPCLG